MNTKEELEAFRDRFLRYSDEFIEAQIRNGSLDNAHREVLVGIIDERRRAVVKVEQQRCDQAERHHQDAKRLAWTAAVISVVSALAALISAWFAWHRPQPPQPPVSPAPTPSVVASPSPTPAPNPVDYISCRQTKLDEDGTVRMTIRNNNGFPIRSISLRIVFTPVSYLVSEPVYQFRWFIPELIQSGEDLEFTAVDASPSSSILASHSHDSNDEWVAKPEFISAESVPK
jgi:hypothetical protein